MDPLLQRFLDRLLPAGLLSEADAHALVYKLQAEGDPSRDQLASELSQHEYLTAEQRDQLLTLWDDAAAETAADEGAGLTPLSEDPGLTPLPDDAGLTPIADDAGDDGGVIEIDDDGDDEPPEDYVSFGEEDRRAGESEMDMTPMVDVTFLLLIFFMVTAAFSLQRSIELPAPEDSEPSTQAKSMEEMEEDPDYVIVRVDSYNTYEVVTADWEEEAPSKQDLLIKLREARGGDSAGNIPTSLLVIAHGDAWHEKVVDAIDAGSAVGMTKVQLVTMEEDDE